MAPGRIIIRRISRRGIDAPMVAPTTWPNPARTGSPAGSSTTTRSGRTRSARCCVSSVRALSVRSGALTGEADWHATRTHRTEARYRDPPAARARLVVDLGRSGRRGDLLTAAADRRTARVAGVAGACAAGLVGG